MRRERERVEWVRGSGALAALGPQWDSLADAQDEPFVRREWLEPWCAAFGGDLEPVICAVWRGDDLVAALPLGERRGTLVALSNIHTPVTRALSLDPEALDTLAGATALAEARRVVVGPLDADEPRTGAIARAFKDRKRLVATAPLYVSPVVDTTGDFAAYRAEMLGKWRRLERRGRKAAREHDLELRTVEIQHRGVGFLEAGLAVEASGWKGRSGTAILSAPDTAQFYREMARRFAARGELALSGMWLDGRLAAFDLALVHGNRYWSLKTGFDESFQAVTPGLVLRRALVERCFDLGLASHELLGADAPWKRAFATSERAHCAIYGYRRDPLSASEWAWRRARPHLRRAYRAIRRPS